MFHSSLPYLQWAYGYPILFPPLHISIQLIISKYRCFMHIACIWHYRKGPFYHRFYLILCDAWLDFAYLSFTQVCFLFVSAHVYYYGHHTTIPCSYVYHKLLPWVVPSLVNRLTHCWCGWFLGSSTHNAFCSFSYVSELG